MIPAREPSREVVRRAARSVVGAAARLLLPCREDTQGAHAAGMGTLVHDLSLLAVRGPYGDVAPSVGADLFPARRSLRAKKRKPMRVRAGEVCCLRLADCERSADAGARAR